MLQLRKNGPGYDGDYLVDLNVKNMSTVAAPPVLPSDQATVAYVDKVVREQLDVKFGGITIQLEGTDYMNVGNFRAGSYVITITPLGIDGAPTATFSVSKNSIRVDGSIMRITGCQGLYTPENLEMQWPENSMLKLRKTGQGYNGAYLVDMNLKNFSTAPTPATIPTDAVTMEYVEQQIEKKMQVKFGGQIVTLENDTTTNIVHLRPGSYIISVTSLVPNGPTASFALSKNSAYGEGSIVRTSSCSGIDSGEVLEILWPQNSMLLLRKTGPFYDGDYIVDFNLKNITPNALIPTLPQDMASKEFVDHEIKESLQVKFGGVEVCLLDTVFAEVAAIRPGSYMVTVIPTVDGCATASFLISKSTISGRASIVRMTSCAAEETGETLELNWPENGKLILRKTGPFHDGFYIVDMNLKNFTSVAPPVLPSDIASKEFVETQIKETMEAKFSGILVDLINADFVPVRPLKAGSYFITVSPTFDGGATATFLVSKSSQFIAGSITRMTFSPAYETDETLEMQWPENGKLILRKTGPFHDGRYLVDFNLKNFTNIPPPVLPSDTVDKSFVENTIKNVMNVKFGGIVVNLKDDESSEITPMKPGSYIVTVSSYVRGGPTATFLISKSGDSVAASIVKATDCPGLDSQVQLQLQWPDQGKLMLRKTGPFFDGDYLVDFNLKNFTTTGPPVLPTDVASKEFVENEVKDIINVRWGGIKVTLEDDRFVQVVPLKAGSYIISVTPLADGGATASFTISKSSIYAEGMIVKVASSPGYETGEMLEMQWPPNDKLYLRKTGPFHDGEYIVDFNLKNFSTLPMPSIPSDNVSKSYVDHAIKENMDIKFGGVVVMLSGMVATQVFPMKPGSYVITVNPLVDGGPTATFSVSKSSNSQEGFIAKVTSFPGQQDNCGLELLWPANGKILLRKDNPFHDGNYLVDANLKNFTTLPEPIIPSDQATREYVDNSIRDTMSARFSGIIVHLVDDKVSDVILLKPGSYVVTVSALKPGGPTSVFNISKTLTNSEGVIVRTSSCPGQDTGEILEILWSANAKLQLHKSGCHHDGDYLVDFNLKNFTELPPVVLPTDNASKEYVDETVKEVVNVKFGGVVVHLEDNVYTDVFALRQGSYFISVSPLQNSAPTATFLVSKSSLTDDASIVKMTSIAGRDTGEVLELIWKENKKLQIRKTGPFYDGDYVVDTNLRNFTETPPPIMPSDAATKAFVEDLVKDTMQAKFSGILVNLQGTEASKVIPLRFGSYIVTVSSVKEGGPTGTFMMSKGSNDVEASVVSITSFPGEDTGELLSLMWPGNSKLLLSKTGPFYDGDYLVDFNLKNISHLPPPELPTDVVTGTFVTKAISEAMMVKFGGIPVHLEGMKEVPVTALKAGSYLMTVSPMKDGNPTATFTISKATQNGQASVVKISSSPGSQDPNENIELVWPENSRVMIRKTGLFHDGDYIVDFNLKNFSNQPPPVFPNDTATKSFVEQVVNDAVVAKFSGIMVHLVNTEPVDVTALKIGSYVVAVTPQIPNAPTATFHISKNQQSSDAHVVRISSCAGVDSGEFLELTWKANSKLTLSKTGTFYDGDYLVDFNLKNFSSGHPPVIPSDVVNVAYLNEELERRLAVRYSGVKVIVEGTGLTEVIALKPGSYMVTVSPTFSEGPSATFAISKSGASEEPSISRLTSCAGSVTEENLELVWPSGGKLCVRKTGPGNNGTYVVDMNLKNITESVYSVVSVGNDGQNSDQSSADLYTKGITVVLAGNIPVPLVALVPGSYVLTVSPRVVGGPTATFSISKSTPDMEPVVSKITGCKGSDGNEDVIIMWPANDRVYIGKTGDNFDGMYVVDTTLKNSVLDVSGWGNPSMSIASTATPSAVKMGTVLQYDFALYGLDETTVAYVQPGTYFAFVCSYEAGLYNATFSLMKVAGSDSPGLTVAMSLNRAYTGELPPDGESVTDFLLALRWDESGTLYVSKTILQNDGMYMLKLI